MKVRDLIKELEGANPDAEVVVDGSAVWCEGILPGYYDGPYDEAQVEETGRISGIKRRRGGWKFKLVKIDVCESIYQDPNNFKVEWDDDDYFSEEYKEKSRLMYEAIRWESLQGHHRFGWRSHDLKEWFPMKEYEDAENPLKEHLPSDWD